MLLAASIARKRRTGRASRSARVVLLFEPGLALVGIAFR
jgi:hypothetical protein